MVAIRLALQQAVSTLDAGSGFRDSRPGALARSYRRTCFYADDAIRDGGVRRDEVPSGVPPTRRGCIAVFRRPTGRRLANADLRGGRLAAALPSAWTPGAEHAIPFAQHGQVASEISRSSDNGGMIERG